MEQVFENEKSEDQGASRESQIADNFNIHRKIFVGNISYRVKAHKLTKFFSKFGPVEHSYIVKDHIKGWSKGIGFITFKDSSSMEKALQATEIQLMLDGSLRSLLQCNPELESIDLSNNLQVTGECFRTAGPSLKCVIMSKCLGVKNRFLNHLAKNSPNLEELDLSYSKGITAEGLRTIIQSFKSLRILKVSATSIEDPSVVFTGPVELVNLEHADISYNTDFSDTSLRLLTQNCPNLRYLDISGCNLLTNHGLISLTRLNHLECLIGSFLSKNSQIEDSLVSIGDRGLLKKLVVRASPFLSNKGVLHIISSCPQLEHLDLSECFNITNCIFEGFKKTFVDENKTVDLYLGGTSVDWVGEDIDWLSGFSHLKVFLNSLALPQMRPDRDLVISEVELSDEEEEYRPHPPITDFLPDGPVEGYDDWEEEFEEFDDYLDNDDPLEAERWDLS